MGDWAPYLWAITPTVVIGVVFWIVMRAIVHGDRNERKAYAKLEAEARARRASTGGAAPARPEDTLGRSRRS